MRPEEFTAWAERSRRGFVDQQVAAGVLPATAAAAYAEEQFARLLPEGLGTPGHHLWTVHAGDAPVGHLWLWVQEHPDGLEGFVVDIDVEPAYRGRGLGRAAMLAAEETARDWGVSALRLNVFGHNAAAAGLYAGLGYRVTAQMLRKDL
jgi:ribosomal protein S18 acetylase RimI-like enzyme